MAPLPFRCCYHEHYHLNLGEHVFPSTKFLKIRERLAGEGLLTAENLLVPGEASRKDLLRVHTPAWVSAMLDGSITDEQVQMLEIPYSKAMVRGFRYHTGGSILAAESAVTDGRAFNIGGGFHHAYPNHGEGFCAIHDVAAAIRSMQAKRLIERAMVIDTDVHQGNGSAAIFAEDATVFTLSIQQLNNYPFHKPPSDLDVNLEDGITDEPYLEKLAAALRLAFQRFEPQLVAYVAGSDPYKEDKLGGLSLTIDGVMRRDVLVLGEVRKRKIPVFVTLAGGYARDLEDTVTLHVNTAKALAQS